MPIEPKLGSHGSLSRLTFSNSFYECFIVYSSMKFRWGFVMMMNDDGGGRGVKITENLLTSYVNDP